MKEVVIDVSPTGDVTIEGKGFTGDECLITQAIEAELGVVTKRVKKPEFNRKVGVTRTVGA